MVKYLGSKRLLLPQILNLVEDLPEVQTVLDPFSGTSRVGFALKARGYQVTSNDLNNYAYLFAKTHVAADKTRWQNIVTKEIADLNQLPPVCGYVTETFCLKSRFFHPHNGAKIDAIRAEIERREYPEELKAILVTSLIEAADRVDSTVGLQMAYLKKYAKRALTPLELKVPAMLEGGHCKAFQGDAFDCLQSNSADLVYLDPPYNQHNYLGNYHIWETIALWDSPETYGVACKRSDIKEKRSPFNSKVGYHRAFQGLIEACQAKYILTSFSDEGFLSKDTLLEVLSSKGETSIFDHAYRRHVCADIGRTNKHGDRKGDVVKKNTEFLIITRVY